MGKNKKVRQLTREGKFIKLFDSGKIAAKELNVNETSISKVCNLWEKTAGGFVFEFLTD